MRCLNYWVHLSSRNSIRRRSFSLYNSCHVRPVIAASSCCIPWRQTHRSMLLKWRTYCLCWHLKKVVALWHEFEGLMEVIAKVPVNLWVRVAIFMRLEGLVVWVELGQLDGPFGCVEELVCGLHGLGLNFVLERRFAAFETAGTMRTVDSTWEGMEGV